MTTYVFRRLIALVITLFVTSMIIFAIAEVVPVDPARAILGQYATDANVEALRQQMGLDRPITERYLHWLSGFVRGDLGQSFRLGTSIRPLLISRLRNSVILAMLGILMLIPVSLVAGIVAGLNVNRWPDWLISTLALLAASTPEFVIGIALILIFAWWLNWLPGTSLPFGEGDNPLKDPTQLVLPAATLALSQVGHMIRITRVSFARVMTTNYIRTAVLKGLPPWAVIFRHALRNAVLAPITVLMTQLGWMVSGLIVIESVFNYPGLGRLFAGAALNNDIPMLEASAMTGIVLAVSSQLLADVVYGFLNPLIRYS